MAVGFYGKLPSQGDFVQRGVTDVFVNRWDAWLQAGLAHSSQELGDPWVELFLTSPLWRFILPAGILGESTWAGILLPSVDRVSRCFPLTLVAELGPEVRPFELSVLGRSWFDWLEQLARESIEADVLDLTQLEAQLAGSQAMLELARRASDPPVEGLQAAGAADVQRLARLGDDLDMGRFWARCAARLLPQVGESAALWWTAGSQWVEPSVLLTRELFPIPRFRELLIGTAQMTPAAPVPGEADPLTDTLVGPAAFAKASQLTSTSPGSLAYSNHSPAQPGLSSATATDPGPFRDENQDALLERPEMGVWLVADGMGGHQAGSLASSLIVERVAAADLTCDLTETIATVKASLLAVNGDLRRRARDQPGFDAGSTVVALCIRGGTGAVLWAGDSRLYRLRDGALLQLTRDHSLANESTAADPADSHVITRAVGGADYLEIEERRFDVLPADRFLLCTDGLYEPLQPTELAVGLRRGDCAVAAEHLVALSLSRGSRDNLTAVCVDVHSAHP
jgi:type VI secretion system protein ImpM